MKKRGFFADLMHALNLCEQHIVANSARGRFHQSWQTSALTARNLSTPTIPLTAPRLSTVSDGGCIKIKRQGRRK